jgi:bis(5'-nucleosyl)-tetraphosphatase (symmetrical)
MDRVQFNASEDQVVFVGDLVNRGPSSAQVLGWIHGLGPRATVVLGNHDLHLLSRHFGVDPPRRRDTLDDVLRAPGLTRWVEWLTCCPFLVTWGMQSFVHAGLLPQWSLKHAEALASEASQLLQGDPPSFLKRIAQGAPPEDEMKQAVDALTRLRTCTPEGVPENDFIGPPAEAPAGYFPWFSVPTRKSKGHRIFFGHWAALGLSQGDDWVGLDTGCVWGNVLTAYCLETGAITQQQSVDVRPTVAPR